MIVLDTNVLSELMRPQPSVQVLGWIGDIHHDDLYITAVTQAEILLGLAILPEGKRRRGLEESASRVFAEDFPGRVLAFDERAVTHFVAISSQRRRRGRPMAILDAMIAGITRSCDATLATRNTKDFEGTRVQLVDPWA